MLRVLDSFVAPEMVNVTPLGRNITGGLTWRGDGRLWANSFVRLQLDGERIHILGFTIGAIEC